MLFLPELFLLGGSLILFFITLGENKGTLAKNVTIAIGLLFSILCVVGINKSGSLFFGAYGIDFYSQFFKLIIGLAMTFVVFLAPETKGINRSTRPEYYLFMMLSVLGLVMLMSSAELLTLFVALELSSYALYLMVPMRDDTTGERRQMEAAIKYVMFGVISTGVMLFGMSYLFGLTGTTYLDELVPQIRNMTDNPVALLAVLMVLAGFFYKLAIFPFHLWVPDVYQGAANPTTAFIATVPKIGAVAIMIRIVTLANPASSEWLVLFLMIAAVASMFYGNLAALVQTDVKRMLGFSGIAHAGFVLLGLLTMDQMGYTRATFYIIGYLLMNLACFLVICNVSVQGENVSRDDLKGLYKRSPFLALVLLVGMFALAGIPPFVGFIGKFMLLAGALQADHLTLVILAALNTAIAIFYYLSVVRVAFTSDPEDRPDVQVGASTWAVGMILMVLIVYMGVAPNKILGVASQAMQVLM
ncbi:MAG: NADH-quinone oxidoreductase subunit N [Desulfobulbaceae bacterium]|nr:MAG: NADH-quinone oxidoreductase subunit N [Desulfobulbaceae bacterium]